MVLTVPVGTQVWSGSGTGQLLADLTGEGDSFVVAVGGRGGRGNAHFASSTNRYPLLAEAGEKGESKKIRLELKLLADVGLVGAPNAGKSSLLAAISEAKPRIADYPFTTTEPVLGVVGHRGVSFVAVEVPGLLEGAHRGVGLGEEFLRHAERTRVLVHVVDGSVDDPIHQLEQVTAELEIYDKGMVSRPRVVAINKADLPSVTERAAPLLEKLKDSGCPAFLISAKARKGIGPLLDQVTELLEITQRRQEQDTGGGHRKAPVLRPKPKSEPVKVRRENGMFVVTAPAAVRIAAMIDDKDWNARAQFFGYLTRTGVVRALEEAGIAPGDMVRIGPAEWEWT